MIAWTINSELVRTAAPSPFGKIGEIGFRDLPIAPELLCIRKTGVSFLIEPYTDTRWLYAEDLCRFDGS